MNAGLFKKISCVGVFVLVAFTNIVISQELTPREFDSLLLNVQKVLVQEKPYREVIQWNEKILEQAKKQHYIKGIVWAHLNISNRYWNYGEPDKSILHLDTVKQLSDTYPLDPLTLARIYQDYSKVYCSIKLYDPGMESSRKAEDLGAKIEDKEKQKAFLSSVYSTRANLYNGVNKPDSSLFCIRKSSELCETPFSLALIANHYLEHEPVHLDSVQVYLDRALTVLNNNKGKSTCYFNSVVYYSYGYFYLKKQDYSRAVQYLETAASFGERKGNIQHLLSIYKLLAESYNHLGNIKKEKDCLATYTRLKDGMEGAHAKSINLSLKSIEEERKAGESGMSKVFWIIISDLTIFVFAMLARLYVRKWGWGRKKVTEDEVTLKPFDQKQGEQEHLERRIEAKEYLIRQAKNNDPTLLEQFQGTYPAIIRKLWQINAGLTQSDLSLCAYIYLGFSSKEIAKYTFMQHRSVQTKKSRLRKKLHLEPEADLYLFLRSSTNSSVHALSEPDSPSDIPSGSLHLPRYETFLTAL